eukprot:TRINITY_DN28076_c0_g1_i1.p1 TRINITY_DN28076_c0_g1~~TRINITY_DN28076_c0_g1_i1.p1  ORF type:complete len:478 (-),score=94.34 TRINITY_DN28076_c0_g1_i1:655-2088(-)
MNDLAPPLHAAVLRYLTDGQWPRGAFPYCAVCRVCCVAVLDETMWKEVNLSVFEEDLPAVPALRLLWAKAEHVRVLSLRGCGGVDDVWIQALAVVMKEQQLRSLDLGYAGNELTSGALSCLANITSLEVLGLKRQLDLSEEALREICQGCPKLSELDVRHCEQLVDSRCLLSGSDKDTAAVWKILKLDGCRRLHIDALFCGAMQSWPRLEELTLDGEGISHDVFLQIAAKCPRLRRFGVSFGEGFDAKALSAFAALPCLRRLRLRKVKGIADSCWASFFEQQRQRKEEALNMMEGHWETLCFGECESWCDGAAQALSRQPQARLRKLDLSWCWQLSDSGVGMILDAARQLQSVKLIGVKNLTDRGLLPCTRLLELRELDVTSVNHVNDWFLQFLHYLFNPTIGLEGEADAETPPRPSGGKVLDIWHRFQPLRKRTAEPLQIKNYYAIYLCEFGRFQAAEDIWSLTEELLSTSWSWSV